MGGLRFIENNIAVGKAGKLLHRFESFIKEETPPFAILT
jgi:hypothetical protein